MLGEQRQIILNQGWFNLTDFRTLKFDPYDVLLLPRNCTKDEIRMVFKAMSLREHPDKHQDPIEKAFYLERSKKLNIAYDILTNERQAFDSWFSNERNRFSTGQQQQYQTGTQADFNDYFRNRRTWTAEEMAERVRRVQRERTNDEEMGRRCRREAEERRRERDRRNLRIRRRNRKVGVFFTAVIVMIILVSLVSLSATKSPQPTLKLTGSYNTNTLPANLQTMLNNPTNSYCGLEDNGLTTICYYDFDANGNYFAFSLEHNNWIYNQVVVDISKLPRTDIGSNHFAFLDMKAYNTCLGTDGINTQCLYSQHNKLFSSGSSSKTAPQGLTIQHGYGVVTPQPTGDKIQTRTPSIQDMIASNTKAYEEQFQKDLSRIHNCMKAGDKGIDQIPC